MQQIISSLAFRGIAYLCFLGVMSTATQAQTIKYNYDALGRVTFVEDATNGNRDYDYDAAGNRVLVVVGLATDDAVVPPAPAAPTGLSCSQIAQGAWRGSWSAVTGASYYIYRTTNPNSGNETTETSTSTVKTSSCSWVKACNASNVCSAKTTF